MKIKKIVMIFFGMIFIDIFGMEPQDDNLTQRQIKKIRQKWKGRESFIDRLFATAKESSDAVAFRAIGEELIAIVDDKNRQVTTYVNPETALITSYEFFQNIINNKEEYKKMHNYKPVNKDDGLVKFFQDCFNYVSRK